MCKYCKHDDENVTAFYQNNFSESVSLTVAIVPEDKQLVFDYSNGHMRYTDVVNIKYCPFCGRPLKGGIQNV